MKRKPKKAPTVSKRRRLTQDLIDKIMDAGPEITNTQLHNETGVSMITIAKYRRSAGFVPTRGRKPLAGRGRAGASIHGGIGFSVYNGLVTVTLPQEDLLKALLGRIPPDQLADVLRS